MEWTSWPHRPSHTYCDLQHDFMPLILRLDLWQLRLTRTYSKLSNVNLGWPGFIQIGRRRPGGGERLRPVSGMRGEGGGVLPRGAGASGALVIVLEASGCGRRANGWCLGRFILRHSVAAASNSLSSSACRAWRRAVNWWIVSSLQKYRVRMDGRAIWRLPGSSRSRRS